MLLLMSAPGGGLVAPTLAHTHQMRMATPGVGPAGIPPPPTALPPQMTSGSVAATIMGAVFMYRRLRA